MAKLMRPMHPSKPVTAVDHAMHDRHNANRSKIEDKPHTRENLQRSIAYNALHAEEHMKAAKDNAKELKKAAKDREKADKK